jgi:hypothetical protein
MTYLELAKQVLTEENKPLTAIEIWNAAIAKEYDKHLNSKGKTPWSTLGAQLYMNAKDEANSIFGQTDARPKKFYLKSMVGRINLNDNSIPEDIVTSRRKKFDFKEIDLHKHLSYYAYYHLRCYTKTIRHNVSNKKEFGEWVHPDMVGCYFRMMDWKQEVKDFSSSIGVRGIEIYSFELKRELSLSNLREVFFQCVSNSSWANHSYIVAAQVSENEDFIEELTRLSASFGIGVIELNIDDPDSTEILIHAKQKKDLDFETINKLAMNKDFKDFLETVKIDVTSRKIHNKEYDAVLELVDLIGKE